MFSLCLGSCCHRRGRVGGMQAQRGGCVVEKVLSVVKRWGPWCAEDRTMESCVEMQAAAVVSKV